MAMRTKRIRKPSFDEALAGCSEGARRAVSFDWRVDVLAGGFPCQDLSLAGNREGLDGERSGLWWEFARIIRLLRPKFVLVENVPGLLAPTDRERQAPIGCVLGELARLGYDAEWQSIPASAFGSTQLRYRVFIVAYPQGHGSGFRVLPARWGQEGEGAGDVARGADGMDTDAQRRVGRQGATEVCDKSVEWRASSEPDRRDSIFVGSGWWSAEPEVGRMVYGVPRRMVRSSIRGLGNAVIPQVAEWIGRRILEAI